MATVSDVVRGGFLNPFPLPYWEDRCAIRLLYVTPQFDDWIDNTYELHNKKLAVGGRTLFEHLEQMLSDFRCADAVHGGELRRMNPTSKGIWHMYPVKLRVFGWCPSQHTFVAVTGATEAETKLDKSLNGKKRDETLDFIKRHKLQSTVLRGDFRDVFPPTA